MNNNEQNFSNTPYKASGNLNTIIGNPDININSAVVSNIMEGSGNVAMPSISDGVNNNNLNNFSAVNLESQSSLMSDSVVDKKQDNVIIEEDPIQSFINKTRDVSSDIKEESTFNQVETTPVVNDNNYVNNNYVSSENVGVNSGYVSNLNNSSNISNVSSNDNVNTSQVRYENTYQTGKKNKSNKKTISIPNEFKTAIFVVLILLIIVSCFDVIYDFFRNLNIFG